MGLRTGLGGLLEERARDVGARPFLVMANGVRLTYAEFNERANQVAHGLAENGVVVGDRVAIMLGNSLEFVLTSYALKKLGAVEVAINTHFRGPGLAHTLNLPEAEMLITESEFVEPIVAIRHELSHLRRIALTDGNGSASTLLADLDVGRFADLVSRRADNPGVEIRDTDLAAVLFTSGTTGPSKGCMLSHRYAVTQGEILSKALELQPSDCLYCPFPLYHVDAAYLTLAPALVLGARAALGRRFSASGFWDEVREFDATVFDFMGATLTILWKRGATSDDADNPVRLAWGVPMPPFRREFERRFGLSLAHGYGLTDGGMPCWESPSVNEPEGSCGKPRHPYDVRIFDDADDEVARGQVGEIVIRPLEGDVIMKGYWGMPDESLAVFRNLWLHTGDYGRMDEQGYLYFAGRKKDAIRRRGENISAWEIEQVLDAHPDVLESAAVGVPSELTEEDVKVFVVTRADSKLTEEELRDFCRARMARFMIPEYVEFIDVIPKTPTGKAAKYKLLARQGEPTMSRGG